MRAVINTKGHKGTFWDNENILHHHCGGNYTTKAHQIDTIEMIENFYVNYMYNII